MKLINIIKKAGFVLIITIFGFTSCDYLDVVPPEQADLSDATKDYNSTLGFLYSCYAGVSNPMNYSTIEAAADEWVLPPLWGEVMHRMVYDNITPQSAGEWRWGQYYRYIGQCHLFLEQLENAKGVTELEKKEWTAEVNFLLAYYHMQVLTLYGPCPITDKYIKMDADNSEYPGRSHFDYVVDWIVEKMDIAAETLPAQRQQDKWGRATSTMAKALKSRLLVYAASPLWNGNFPYPEWKNVNYETPGYGLELVSGEYDRTKWERALESNLDALNYAENTGGNALYEDITMNDREDVPLPFVPGVNPETEEGETFLEKVLLMRYLVTTRTTEGNDEIIWGLASQGNMINGSIPHFIQYHNNGTVIGYYSGVSPIFNTSISNFYTKNGKRPANDPDFAQKETWLRSAGIPGRSDIITFNIDREPRFYAWFAFDGGDYASKLADGSPLKIELRNAEKQGYNPAKFNRDNNVTGYFSQKFIMPNLSISKSDSWNIENKPRTLIRLAELYLNVAESYASLGDVPNAIKYLNVIRERAGVPDLTPEDVTNDMTIVEWVRNERSIELWGEGHRYYDIRRWMTAPQTMGQGMRLGLNAYGTLNPTFEEFNTVVPINQPFVWTTRMYLLPIFHIEVYKNPQMIQSPGYN